MAASSNAASDLAELITFVAIVRADLPFASIDAVEDAKVICNNLNPAVRAGGIEDGPIMAVSREFHLRGRSISCQ